MSKGSNANGARPKSRAAATASGCFREEGRSNQGIGKALFLSPKTVETHIHAIFQKLGLEAGADDHRRVLAVLAYLNR